MEQRNNIASEKQEKHFLPLINDEVNIGLSFLLLRISAITSSNTINIFRFLFGFYSSIFLQISSISFEYLIEDFESFKYFKPVLSLLFITNWYFASYESSGYKDFLSIYGSWYNGLSNALFFQIQNLQLLKFYMDGQ